MTLGRQERENKVKSAAGHVALLALWGFVSAFGRLMRSWLGALVLAGAVLVASNWGGGMIGVLTGSTGPLDYLGEKVSSLLVGPSEPASAKPSRVYGDSPQEKLNEAVELYLRQVQAKAFRNPESLTLVGDAVVLSSSPQADGNFRLEIEAVFDMETSIFGISTGSRQEKMMLLAVEDGRNHSITVYSFVSVAGG